MYGDVHFLFLVDPGVEFQNIVANFEVLDFQKVIHTALSFDNLNPGEQVLQDVAISTHQKRSLMSCKWLRIIKINWKFNIFTFNDVNIIRLSPLICFLPSNEPPALAILPRKQPSHQFHSEIKPSTNKVNQVTKIKD